MKKNLLLAIATLLIGCEQINPQPDEKPFEQAWKFKEDYILVNKTATIEYTVSGIKEDNPYVVLEFDESLEITINGSRYYRPGSTQIKLEPTTNRITILPTKPGKYTFSMQLSGKPKVVIPIVVNQRGYVIENLIENTELQATYRYPTKFRIVDKADSTDNYTKRKYEISAWIKNQSKATILVGSTKVRCDTTADFTAGFATDQSFEFEGEFTPWGGGEYEVNYRIMDEDGVTMDCPVKYNVKPTQVDFKVLKNSGEINITDKGIKVDLQLTPTKGTQSAYYIAMEGVYKDEIWQLDDQGVKMATGAKKQIVSFKEHDGQTINKTIYLQTEKNMSGAYFSGSVVLYSNGERWEIPYAQRCPIFKPVITYTTNDLVHFGDNNMIYLTYEFDKRSTPTKDSKLKIKLRGIQNEQVSLPDGTFIESNVMIDVTEFFSENTNPMQRTLALKVGNTFYFDVEIHDEFGAVGELYVKAQSKSNKLQVEAQGEFIETFPNPIDFKLIASFEITGKNDKKLNNLKVTYKSRDGESGYFIINGVEIKKHEVEIEINNMGGNIDAKYIPTSPGPYRPELWFTTADGRIGKVFFWSN